MRRFPVEESKATAGTGTRVTDVTGSDIYYLSPYNSLAPLLIDTTGVTKHHNVLFQCRTPQIITSCENLHVKLFMQFYKE